MYFLPFMGQDISESLIVTLPIMLIASFTAVLSLVSYIWIPKESAFPSSLVIYILLTATVAGLIITTDGATSPFIALWMLVSVFAGIFGIWGLLPMAIAVGVFVAVEYLQNNFSPELMVVVSFVGILPLIASLIIWHNKSNKAYSGDKAYKELASELSQVATQSEVVINAIGDGVMAIDAKGTIQLINPAAQQILGWGKQDALALNYRSVLQLIDLKGAPVDPASDPIQQVLNTNQQIRNNDTTIVTKSSKKIISSIVASPIGEVGSGAIIVFRDITKEKAEEREQAEFISTASHEMRTPVASIEGYLGLALNPQTSQIDEKARDFIMKAHESAQHLGHLFQDLLDVSKADDKRLTNTPKVVDMTSFTEQVVQGLTPKAVEKGLNLVFKPNPKDGNQHVAPVYHVNLDNDHIREILDNLIENAIKYTLKGQVTVDVNGTEDSVVVSIQDSGIGIPAEDIPHLFQKFYRVNNEETNQIGGTGLGLYLCRKLAEAMNGRIWAESTYRQGSTFYVELPRISSQEATNLQSQQALTAQNVSDTSMNQVESVAAIETPALTDTSNTQSVAIQTPTPQSSAPMTNSTAQQSPEASAKPATTVPRGESLTPEQIAAHVAELKEMIKQQQAAPSTQPQETPPTSQ